MKTFKQYVGESAEIEERCWTGYKPTPGKKPYEKGSCMKEGDDDIQEDAEHEGKKVTLNKPFRTPDGPKKFAVYVKNDKGNVVKVTFGDPDMEIKRDSDNKRANFRARHNCDDPGPKWKARYWSCKMWSNKPVSKLTEDSDVSQAAKLFSKFIKTTGAPEKVNKFVPNKSHSGNTVFTGTSTNSKFTYLVDVENGTVEASKKGALDGTKFVWNQKDNRVRVVESRINEKKDV